MNQYIATHVTTGQQVTVEAPKLSLAAHEAARQLTGLEFGSGWWVKNTPMTETEGTFEAYRRVKTVGYNGGYQSTGDVFRLQQIEG